MKRLALALISVLTFSLSFGQGFEGTIEFKKIKGTKSTSYIYYVKGDQVRLEEFGSNKTIVDLVIIDLKEEQVYMLSPERKSYMILNTKESSKDMSKTRVNITTETKTIQGYPCKKWVISNGDLDAKVTYWVTEGQYDFFVKLLATLQRKDFHSLFYRQVPAAVGFFPMVSTLTDMAGVERERLEVVSIKKMQLTSKTFAIPSDYTEFKTN